MWLFSIMSKTLISCYEKPFFFYNHFPYILIIYSLIYGSSNIFYIMPHLSKGSNGHLGNIFVSKDFHYQLPNVSIGVTSSSANDPA